MAGGKFSLDGESGQGDVATASSPSDDAGTASPQRVGGQKAWAGSLGLRTEGGMGRIGASQGPGQPGARADIFDDLRSQVLRSHEIRTI